MLESAKIGLVVHRLARRKFTEGGLECPALFWVRGSAVERLVDIEKVRGSTPLGPTKRKSAGR